MPGQDIDAGNVDKHILAESIIHTIIHIILIYHAYNNNHFY